MLRPRNNRLHLRIVFESLVNNIQRRVFRLTLSGDDAERIEKLKKF